MNKLIKEQRDRELARQQAEQGRALAIERAKNAARAAEKETKAHE